MPIGQINMEGKDKVQVSIDRLREFEPEQGYYLAFSGGKDSEVIKQLAIEAGVKFDAHYNHTTVDPPELIYHMRKYHSDVIIDKPEITMWRLIEKRKFPPTGLMRYCCDKLKEGGGEGRVVITGVRWAESARRKNTREEIEIFNKSKSKKAEEQKRKFYDGDPDDKRRMMESCVTKGKFIINPIVDWENEDVWEYIKSREIKYCSLYDEGFHRLGCIGCPMQGRKGMEREFERWPKYRDAYVRTFERMLKTLDTSKQKNQWKTGEDVMQWWMR